MTTIIIPAAGYGSRVQNLLSQGQSKELLKYKGEHLIDRAIKSCDGIIDSKIIVISRAEKTDLIEHLKAVGVQVHLVPPTQEWTESVLKSEDFWTDWNVILLPDTTFSPPSALKEICYLPDKKIKWMAAGFKTLEPQKWGVINLNETSIHLQIAEKPNLIDAAFAWGLLAFRKEIGLELWSKMRESSSDHGFKTIKGEGKLIDLESFHDLTRG